MERLLDLIIVSLAVWRLSSLFVHEDGPWMILEKLRYGFGVRYDEHSNRYGDGMMGELFNCVWCMSIWIGTAAGLSYMFFPDFTVHLGLIPALSAAAIIVEEKIKE